MVVNTEYNLHKFSQLKLLQPTFLETDSRKDKHSVPQIITTYRRQTMKVTVNKAYFLEQALPIIDFNRITLAAYGGVLSVASFGNTVKFRVPAYVAEPGQEFMTSDEWHVLVSKIQSEPLSMVDN